MSDTDNHRPSPPTVASSRPLAQCRTLREALETDEFKRRIDQARPSQTKTDAILNSFLQACSRTPDLLHCEMRSVVGGFLTLAELGLPLTPSLGLAHMIPFRGRVQNPKTRKWEDGYNLTIIIGYQGYIELAMRTGRIGGIHADVVYPEDSHTGIWEYEFGTRQDLRHRPSRERSPQSKPTEAYCIAHIVGDVKPPFEVYPWSKVIGIRDRSQGYLKALAAKNAALAEGKAIPRTFTDAPWVRDEESMAKKTMIRAAQKMWPKSPELRGAAVVDDPERGYVDFGPIVDARPGDVQAADLPVEEEPGDPGAAYGVRTQLEPQQQERRADPPSRKPAEPPQPKPTASKPKAAEPPAEEEPPPAEPGDFGAEASQQEALAAGGQPGDEAFEYYVLDAIGEAVTDQITDPVAWAKAFSNVWLATDPDMRNAMIEQNMDTLAEARAHPGTDGYLRDVMKRRTQDKHPLLASASAPQAVAVPLSRGGKHDWIGYMKAIRDVLPALGLSIAAGPWVEAQIAILGECPTTQRLNLITDITKRLAEFGQKPPPSLAALVQSKPAAPAAGLFESAPNPDRAWIDARKAEIDGCGTVEAIKAITNTDTTTAFLRGLRERDPAMVGELVEHAKARANALGASA